MLPDWTETIKRASDDWVCIVRHKNNNRNDHAFDEKEVNARAKMLIYLIENKLIEFKDENILKLAKTIADLRNESPIIERDMFTVLQNERNKK